MKRTPWHFGIAAAVAIACGLSVSGYKTGAAPQDKQPTGVEVKIDNFSFGPAELTISVGTQVTWTNRDDVPLLLLHSSENDGQNRGAVTSEAELNPFGLKAALLAPRGRGDETGAAGRHEAPPVRTKKARSRGI